MRNTERPRITIVSTWFASTAKDLANLLAESPDVFLRDISVGTLRVELIKDETDPPAVFSLRFEHLGDDA